MSDKTIDALRGMVEATAAYHQNDVNGRPWLKAALEVLAGPAKGLYSVTHEHRYGQDTNLVRADHFPTDDEVVQALEINYEPDLYESLDINVVNEGTIVELPAEHPQTDEHLAACPSCMMEHDKRLPNA